MRRGHGFFCILALTLIFLLLLGTTGARSQLLPFRYYSLKDGLVSEGITALCQDRRGFLWIGTSEGISVYDGYEFTNYRADDGLPVTFVTDIIESDVAPGVMWIATLGGGVSRFADGTFELFTLGSTAEENQITALLEDDSGRLVCAGSEDLYILQDGVPSRFPRAPDAPPPFSIAQTPSGDLWVSTRDGVEIYGNDFRHRETLNHTFLTALCADSLGILWGGSADGRLYRFKDALLLDTFDAKTGAIRHFAEDTDGNLWASTNNGLLHITIRRDSVDHITRYSTENGLRDERIGVSLVDREGNLWFGGFGQGLYRWSARGTFVFPVRPLPAGYFYFPAATADQSGALWAISSDGLLEFKRSRHRAWTRYVHDIFEKGGVETPFSVQIDQSGDLWVNSSRGLQPWKIIPNPSGPSQLSRNPMPASLHLALPQTPWLFHAFDRDNNMWICTPDSGLFVISPLYRRLRIFTMEDGLPATDLRAFHQDRDGNVWVGGFAGGLAMLPAQSLASGVFRLFTRESGLPDERIRAIHQDQEGRLWVGTRYGGIAVLEGGSFRAVTIREGLLSNTVWWIAAERSDRMWLGTQMGLQALMTSSERPVKSPWAFTERAIICCGVTDTAFVWAYAPDAVLVSEISPSSREGPPPLIHISRMEVNTAGVDFGAPLSLTHDQNFCTIEFVGISFRDGEHTRYQFRLLEEEKEWCPPTTRRVVTYASLQPGSYRFEVRAVAGDGRTSASPASVAFGIAPPYWGTWWFRLGLVAACAALLFLLYRLRVRRLLAVERMRVRIASDLHDDVGSTLTRISLYSDLVKSDSDPVRSADLIGKIGAMSRELVTNMSDIVWSIDSRHDTAGDLFDRMKEFSLSVLGSRNIDVTFATDGFAEGKPLTSEFRQNVYLIFKEAVNNIVKHSGATEVAIQLSLQGPLFRMIIRDNGRVWDGTTHPAGHGLRNMALRAERIGASLEVTTREGTTVSLVARGL